MPKSRVEFWQKKFRKNLERDTVVQNQLQKEGVRMLIIWECTVKSMIKNTILRENVLDRIDSFMRSEESFLEL
jgi:DNA mismatch endonuclease (patch repair protein)